MVVTRRATALRRGQRARAPGGGGGSNSASGPGDAAGMASAEVSTPVPVRVTRRRTKSVCKPEVIQESQFEELEHTETKSDVSDSLEMQFTRNENTTVHSPRASGDVSETESSCSAVSGLQTPLFVRKTRRRQIVVPYRSDSPDKKIQDKPTFLNRLSRITDEDDVSEAESCSSAVFSVQMPSVTRTTGRRESKKKLQPDTGHEAQSEDNSDAELCYLSSYMESSVTSKRITRSMQRKLETANTKQKGDRIVSEDESLIEDTVRSDPVVISDCRPAAGLLYDTEDVSSVTEDNKEPSLPSRSAVSSEDVEEQVLNDVTPSSFTKIKQSDVESPEKKPIENTESVGVDDSEEARGQIQEQPSKILQRQGKTKCMTLSLTDCVRSKQWLESQGQVTLHQSKKIPDAESDAQGSFDHAGKLTTGDQSSAVSSPQKDIAVAQRNDSFGRPRIFEIGVDGGKDGTGEYAESVCQDSESLSSGNNSLTLFLSKGESDESENSDVVDIDTVEDNLCIEESDEKTPSCNKSLKDSSLPSEGLFVIDTEPGMRSSQKYYLDEVDQDSDSESKHEGSGKDEKSSDLEEAEEDLIDEDEKDEDDDLLKTKVDFLSLSSNIDPGLNIKKLGGLYITFDAKNQKPRSNVINQLKEKNKDKLLQNSIITPDFEKKECVPPFRESLHQLKKQRKAEREKTAGDGWFGMKAPEMTSELKNDLKVLKMRASLDPKRFYKKNDRDGLPKYFQVGTVVDSPIDFYHSRIPKKQRKRTIVDELLADSEFRRYNKKKYQEIMSEKAAFAAGKRNRKKKKFRN